MSRFNIMIDFLEATKELSKCKHGKVAAILTNNDLSKITSIGVNGGPAGGEDCICGEADAKYGCVHAETNCLIKNRDFNSPIMFITKAPCPTCAAMIVNAGYIHAVYYGEDYKDCRGIKILSNADIYVQKYDKCAAHARI